SPSPHPSPVNAGESHVGFCKSLLTKGKWILKVASDSEGAADERIWRVLCRPAFRRFMKAFAAGAKIKRPRGVIALDGKALRRGYERGKSHMPTVMVTAWGAQTRMALDNVMEPEKNEGAGDVTSLSGLLFNGV